MCLNFQFANENSWTLKLCLLGNNTKRKPDRSTKYNAPFSLTRHIFLKGSGFGFADKVFMIGFFYLLMSWITICLQMWLWTKMLDGVQLQPHLVLGVLPRSNVLDKLRQDACFFHRLKLSNETSVLHKPTLAVQSAVESPSMIMRSKSEHRSPLMFHLCAERDLFRLPLQM